jgi:hypothetical protein
VKTEIRLILRPDSLPLTLQKRWQQHRAELSLQVLQDCNRYARDDTGRLIASSGTASVPEKGLLRWRTPYARRVYYTGIPSRVHNPGASLRWCEKAKALHARMWIQMAARLLGGE